MTLFLCVIIYITFKVFIDDYSLIFFLQNSQQVFHFSKMENEKYELDLYFLAHFYVISFHNKSKVENVEHSSVFGNIRLMNYA